MPDVRELRLSLIWTDVFARDEFEFWRKRRERYEQAIEDALTKSSEHLTVPWIKRQRQDFWKHYLETRKLKNLSVTNASRHLMPLRFPSTIHVATESPKSHQIAVERFWYPHGLAVVITLFLQKDLELEQMVDETVKARHGRYTVAWPEEDRGPEELSLNQLAQCALDRTHGTVAGEAGPQRDLAAPFTIATVINARGVELEPVRENSGLHRALQGLCSLDDLWKDNQLSPFNDSTCFKQKQPSPAGHVLYGWRQGRGIWFPGYFEGNLDRTKIRKLGSYHRNLVFASLQDKSLVGLMQYIEGFLKQGAMIPHPLEYFSKYAAGALGRFYGGRKTYRSWSAHEQIHHSRNAVDTVRDYFGFPPLYESET
jgi:hypothetical protein